VLGVIDDVTKRTPMGFKNDGDTLILLGDTREELSGSEWAWVTHQHLGGVPPRVDLARERVLADVLVAASRDGLVAAAHDLSDGGLAQALTESCLRYGVGANVMLPAEGSAFVWLFSESAGRVLVAVPPGQEHAFTELCSAKELPWHRIGVVDAQSGALDIQGEFAVPLSALREAYEGTLPKLFG
jgi:phosphoribosylformylglycinamidine synthase